MKRRTAIVAQQRKTSQVIASRIIPESTLYRTIQSYGLCCQVFSNISAEELDPYRLELSREFPFFGEEMMKFLLQERRNKVQIMHLWNSIHRVDEGRVRERKKVDCSTHL